MAGSDSIRKEAIRITQSRESLERWLAETAAILFTIYMTENQGDDVRTACMDAVNALEWLKTPPERIEIVYQKPPYKRRGENDKPPTGA